LWSANREAVLHQLEERGIRIIHNAIVQEVQQQSMTVQVTPPPQSESDEESGDTQKHEREQRDSSRRLVVYEFTHCVWATGADCHHPLSSSLREQGLALSDRGWIAVNDCFQSSSHPYVFASGDCCAMEMQSSKEKKTASQSPSQSQSQSPAASSSRPHSSSQPKAGVYAVRAGPILLENLTRYLLNDDKSSLQSYVPQTDFLKLLGCGDGTAQGFRFGIPFSGKWVFQLKNAIDRTFIDLFKQENLPELINGQVYAASQQFDTVSAEDRPAMMLPMDAALLLQRTDDYVDYQQAWDILREMTKNETYREEVIVCYQQDQNTNSTRIMRHE